MSTVEQLNQRSKFNQRCWQMFYTRKKFCIANLSHASLLDFSPFSKKIRVHSYRFLTVFARPPTSTRWIDLKTITYPTAHACSLLWTRKIIMAPSLNFFGVGLYSCCDVLQSQQSQSKGRSSLPPLDTSSESNLIIGSAASWNNQLKFAWKQAIGLKISRSIKDNKGKRPSAILSKFLILCGVDWNW